MGRHLFNFSDSKNRASSPKKHPFWDKAQANYCKQYCTQKCGAKAWNTHNFTTAPYKERTNEYG